MADLTVKIREIISCLIELQLQWIDEYYSSSEWGPEGGPLYIRKGTLQGMCDEMEEVIKILEHVRQYDDYIVSSLVYIISERYEYHKVHNTNIVVDGCMKADEVALQKLGTPWTSYVPSPSSPKSRQVKIWMR